MLMLMLPTSRQRIEQIFYVSYVYHDLVLMNNNLVTDALHVDNLSSITKLERQ